jgi:nitrous-oxide reductase
MKIEEKDSTTSPDEFNRRKFLSTAALLGLAGAGLSTGLAACKKTEAPVAAGGTAAAAGAVDFNKYEVRPGQLDDYYVMSSGGHSAAS